MSLTTTIDTLTKDCRCGSIYKSTPTKQCSQEVTMSSFPNTTATATPPARVKMSGTISIQAVNVATVDHQILFELPLRTCDWGHLLGGFMVESNGVLPSIS